MIITRLRVFKVNSRFAGDFFESLNSEVDLTLLNAMDAFAPIGVGRIGE